MEISGYRAGVGAAEPVIRENMRTNHAFALESEHIKLVDALYPVVPKSHALLMGASPSIHNQKAFIRGVVSGDGPSFACNGVAAWMAEHNLGVPQFICIVDYKPRAIRYLMTAPRPTKGLVLSTSCDPSLFKWAEEKKLTTVAYNPVPLDGMDFLGGGSSIVGRMLIVMGVLGYETIHVVGASSDVKADGPNYAYDHPEPSPRVDLRVTPDYPWRITTPNLAAQAYEIPHITKQLDQARGTKFLFYDKDSLLADYLTAYAKGDIKGEDLPANPFETAPEMDFGGIQKLV